MGRRSAPAGVRIPGPWTPETGPDRGRPPGAGWPVGSVVRGGSVPWSVGLGWPVPIVAPGPYRIGRPVSGPGGSLSVGVIVSGGLGLFCRPWGSVPAWP